jgi:ATP-dependent Clp protease ATP-binding subunit ClpA
MFRRIIIKPIAVATVFSILLQTSFMPLGYAGSKWEAFRALLPFGKKAAEVTAHNADEVAKAGLHYVDDLAGASKGLFSDLSRASLHAETHVPTVGINSTLNKALSKLDSPESVGIILVGDKGVGKSAVMNGIQDGVVAAEQQAKGQLPEHLSHLKDVKIPESMKGAKVIRIDATNGDIGVVAEFATKIRLLETQLMKHTGPIVLHFSDIKRFIAPDNNEGIIQLGEHIQKLRQQFGANRIKIVLEGTAAEVSKMKAAMQIFNNFAEVPVKGKTIDQTVEILKAQFPILTKTKGQTLNEGLLRTIALLGDKYYAAIGSPNGAMRVLQMAIAFRKKNILNKTYPLIEALKEQIAKIEAQIAEVSQLDGKFAKELQQELPKARNRLLGDLEKATADHKDFLQLQSIMDDILIIEQRILAGKYQDAEKGIVKIFGEGQVKNKEQALALIKQVKEKFEAKKLAVTEQDLIFTINDELGIPLESVIKHKGNVTMAEHIALYEQTIKGQTSFITRLVTGIRNHLGGLIKPTKPFSVLVVGKTGSGKSMSAKAVKTIETHGKGVDIECNTMTDLNTSKVEGAAPGLVGYGESGMLREEHDMQTITIVLEEFGRGSPNLYDTLMRLIDEGIWTLPSGKVINLKRSFIMANSNIGEDLPKGATRAEIIQAFVDVGFKREQVDRIDIILRADDLSDEILKEITGSVIDRLNKEYRESFLRVTISPKATESIMVRLKDTIKSGRNVGNIISESIQSRVQEAFSSGQYLDDFGRVVNFSIKKGDDILIDFTEEAGMVLRLAP